MVSAMRARTASTSSLRLGQGDPGLEAADRVQPVHARRQLALVEAVEAPEAGRLVERPIARAIEHAGRQHADHLVRLVVEQQVAAEDAGVAAEVRLPGGVADQHHLGGAGLVFFGPEAAADHRLHAEHGEVIRRHVASGEADRLAVDHHRRGRGRFGRQRREASGSAAAARGRCGWWSSCGSSASALSQMRTIRSGSGKGIGLNSTPSTRLNIAVLAPMPSASTPTATAVKPGMRSRAASP